MSPDAPCATGTQKKSYKYSSFAAYGLFLEAQENCRRTWSALQRKLLPSARAHVLILLRGKLTNSSCNSLCQAPLFLATPVSHICIWQQDIVCQNGVC